MNVTGTLSESGVHLLSCRFYLYDLLINQVPAKQCSYWESFLLTASSKSGTSDLCSTAKLLFGKLPLQKEHAHGGIQTCCILYQWCFPAVHSCRHHCTRCLSAVLYGAMFPPLRLRMLLVPKSKEREKEKATQTLEVE